MRAIKLLITLLLGLTVVASAAVAALFFVEPSTYRNQIEQRFGAALGRSFEVVGPIELEKSLRPKIILNEITIANPEWAAQPYFVAAERVGVQVALVDLLRGDLRILDLAFDGVMLSVEENSNGDNNYTFATRSDEQEPALMPALEQLSITNSAVEYRPAQGDSQTVQIETVRLQNIPGMPQQLEGHGVLKGKKLTFSAIADTPDSKASTKPAWALKASLTGSDMAAAITTRLGDISEWQRADYRVSLSGSGTAEMADLADIELPTVGRFDVSARISKRDATIEVADVAGQLRLRPHLPLIEITSGAVSIADDEALNAALQGQFGDDPVKLELTTLTPSDGSPDNVEQTMMAQLKLANMELSIKAQKASTLAGGRLAFDTELGGENLDTLARILHTELPEVGPYQLSFHADIGPDHYTFTKLNGSIARTGAWSKIAIVDGEVSGTDAGTARASIKTKLDGIPLSLDVEGNVLSKGNAATSSWPFKLKAETTGVTLSGEGLFGSSDEKLGLKLATHVRGNQTDALNSLLGISVPPLGKFDVRATVSSDGAIHAFDDLDVRLGKNRFSGRARWDGEAPRPKLTLKLSTQQLNLDTLFAPSAKTARGTSDNSLLDMPIGLDGLSDFDARAELEVAQLANSVIDIRHLKSTVTLIDGSLDIPVRGRVLRNNAEFRIQVQETKSVPTVSLSATAENVDIAKVVRQLKLPTAIAGTADAIQLKARSTGSTLKDWVEQATFELQAEQARVSHMIEIAGESFATEIKSVSIVARENRPVGGSLSGLIAEKPLAVTFSTATLKEIVGSTTALPLSLSVQTNDLHLKTDGSVRRPLDSQTFDLRYELVGKDIERLSSLTDFAIPLRGEFRTKGRVKGRADQVTLQDELRVGSSNFEADLSLSLAGTRPKLSGSVIARQIHADDVDIFDADKRGAAASSERVISDYTLPVEALFGIDLDLLIKANGVKTPAGSIGNLTSSIRLSDGRFASSLTVAEDHGVRINTEFRVDAKANPPPVKVRMKAQGIDFGHLTDALGTPGLVQGQGDVNVAVDGTGVTRYDILGNASGRITVIGGPGQIASRNVDLWAADLIPTMLSTSWRREDVTETNCMVAHIELKNGIAELENLLLDTRRMTVGGSGTMDLKTEALNVVLAPRPKRASLISLANPVRIKGTLSAPAISVTRMPGGNRLTTGASLLAGLINPVFLIFALSDTGTGEANPCESAVEETRKSAGVE